MFIADHYGRDAQSVKACEELAELIQAICRHMLSPTDAALENLIEEIADAEIMIDQIKYLCGAAPIDVELKAAMKLKRTMGRIRAEMAETAAD